MQGWREQDSPAGLPAAAVPQDEMAEMAVARRFSEPAQREPSSRLSAAWTPGGPVTGTPEPRKWCVSAVEPSGSPQRNLLLKAGDLDWGGEGQTRDGHAHALRPTSAAPAHPSCDLEWPGVPCSWVTPVSKSSWPPTPIGMSAGQNVPSFVLV